MVCFGWENVIPYAFTCVSYSFHCLNDLSMVGEEKKILEHTVLQQPRQPIHKLCLWLHGHTNVKDTAKGKTREEETTKVIVRSAYFQHKQVEKNVYDRKQDCMSFGIAYFIGQMEKAQSREKLHQRCKYVVFAVYISFGPYFLLNVCQIRMLTQIFASRPT